MKKLFLIHRFPLPILLLILLLAAWVLGGEAGGNHPQLNNANPFLVRAAAQDASQIKVPDEPVITHSGREWYYKATLIHHACGSINRKKYTNSREALNATLRRGGRFVEVDFLLTTDGKPVCAHDWERLGQQPDERMSSSEFFGIKIYEKYSPLWAGDILQYMRKYPDLYIIVDTKDDLKEIVEILSGLDGFSEVADRFIIQLYAPGQKQEIEKIYDFPDENYLLTLYMLEDQTLEHVLSICSSDEIRVITAPKELFTADEVKVLKQMGYILYEHTYNLADPANQALKRGVRGLYTDFLWEVHLNTSRIRLPKPAAQ